MRGRGTLLLAAAALATACGASRDIAEQSFVPRVTGELTVATSLPAPGFWDGTDVAHLTGGFERGIAAALAARFGLRLHVVEEPFDAIVAGDLGGADLAIAQITTTAARRQRLTFSAPYYRDDAGAVVAEGHELTDLKTAREQRWAVQRSTTEQQVLDDVVRPDDAPLLVDDPVAAIEAVSARRADAALVDLSTALVLTHGRADVTTGGRFVTDGAMAVGLPKGSSNVEVVDAALQAFDADRTLHDLRVRYLDPVFEQDPASVPVIRTPSS